MGGPYFWGAIFPVIFESYCLPRAKKSSLAPLWGHRQPETALARGLNNVEIDKIGEHKVLVKYM